MKFIPGEDWQQKIARVERIASNVKATGSLYRPPAPRPLTEAERRRVEEATRYERFRDMVSVLGGARLPIPQHKSCQ